MKFFSKIKFRSRRTNISAFTLVEMMVSVGVFLSIFVGVMVAVQLFGLRVYTLAATKLTATAGSRKALDQVRDDIREAKTINVGNWSSSTSTFTLIGTNNLQQGSALQIFPNTATNNYLVYYLDTSASPTNKLMQYTYTNGVTGSMVLASYITNLMVFDAEDYLGNIITNQDNANLDNRLVIRMTLQFSEWEYPIGYVGGVGLNAYDYYQLRTRVFRRAFN